MSCCEIIPNNSVHWAVTHEKLDGSAKARTARPKSPANGDNGDYVTIEPDRVVGVDSMAPAEVGTGKAHGGKKSKDHDGHFEVTLRFGTATEARDAAALAVSQITQETTSGMYNLVLRVRAIQRTSKQAEAAAPNPYAQICTVW